MGPGTIWNNLCLPCYDRLRKQIRDGLTTWAEAEASGLLLPADREAQRRWGSGAQTMSIVIDWLICPYCHRHEVALARSGCIIEGNCPHLAFVRWEFTPVDDDGEVTLDWQTGKGMGFWYSPAMGDSLVGRDVSREVAGREGELRTPFECAEIEYYMPEGALLGEAVFAMEPVELADELTLRGDS